MKRSIENSERYQWGDACSAWHLVKTENLSIKQESMPAHTEEQRHFHDFSRQFFYILKGTATFIVADKTMILVGGEGLEIEPKTVHQIKNNSDEILDFLVISQPATERDRIDKPITKDS